MGVGRLLCNSALVLALTLSQASVVRAQIVNVLGKIKKGEDGLSGEIGLAFGFKSGNTTLFQAKAELGVSYTLGPHFIYLVGRARFGTRQPIEKLSLGSFDKDKVYISRVFEHLRYRYEVMEWFEAEGFIQHEADKFRDLGTRFLVGVGPRVTVEPLDDFHLAAGVAYMFEHEVYNKSPIDSATSHRLSSYIQADLKLDDTFSLHNTTFVQPRFVGDTPILVATRDRVVSDLRVSSDSTLQIKVNSWLSVKLGLRIGYNSNTPPQVGDLICSDGAPATGTKTDIQCAPDATVDHLVTVADLDEKGRPRQRLVKGLDISFDTAFVLTY